MARVSRYGGVSFTEHEASDPAPPIGREMWIRRPQLGLVDRQPYKANPREEMEESPSVQKQEDGGNSIQSSESAETSDDVKPVSRRKRAPTTGNRSRVKETSSTAHLTDGSGDTEFDEFA